MKKKKKKIPIFKSEEEEARFWGAHSPLDYAQEFKEVKDPFKFDSRLLKKAAKRQEERKRLLTLRIGQRQVDLAKIIAKWKGLGYQTQMRLWVMEGIRREIAAHPEIKRYFASH